MLQLPAGLSGRKLSLQVPPEPPHQVSPSRETGEFHASLAPERAQDGWVFLFVTIKLPLLPDKPAGGAYSTVSGHQPFA